MSSTAPRQGSAVSFTGETRPAEPEWMSQSRVDAYSCDNVFARIQYGDANTNANAAHNARGQTHDQNMADLEASMARDHSMANRSS